MTMHLGILYYEDSNPHTCACFGHVCGHIQGCELQKMYQKNINLPIH